MVQLLRLALPLLLTPAKVAFGTTPPAWSCLSSTPTPMALVAAPFTPGRAQRPVSLQAQLVERVGELEKRDPELYLEKAGGMMTGALACTRPGQTAAGTYILSVKAEGLKTGKQVAFRVTADGAVKAGHDTSHPFMASSKNDVVTKAYLDSKRLVTAVGFVSRSATTKKRRDNPLSKDSTFFINDLFDTSYFSTRWGEQVKW